MKLYDDFTNLQSVTKTLRFELKPVEETKQIIDKKELLKDDYKRSESYPIVKELIDDNHKDFIETVLKDFEFSDKIKKYAEVYFNSDNEQERTKQLKEIASVLRREMYNCLKSHEDFKAINNTSKLIEEKLFEVADENQKEHLQNFHKFTGYFDNFKKNRVNMYTDEEKSTAIPYRAINDNLPRFLDNTKSFEKVSSSSVSGSFIEIEKELGIKLIEYFNIEFYKKGSALTQSGITKYNEVIGGRKDKDEKNPIKGLNQYINEYNQVHKKKERLPLLKPLYKQILTERQSLSFIPEKFESDNELLESIYAFSSNANSKIIEAKDLFATLSDYDINGIFTKNDKTLTKVSNRIFGDYDFFNKKVIEEFKTNNPIKKQSQEKYEKRINDYIKSIDCYSIGYLESLTESESKVSDYFKGEAKILIDKYESSCKTILPLLSKPYPKDGNLINDKENVALIKDYLDSVKNIQYLLNCLKIGQKEAVKDEVFYSKFDEIILHIDPVTLLYDKVRNYLTRKPYSTKKIEVHFGINKNLNGWVDSKTESSDNGTQYGGYLFRKKNSINEYDYYLGISAKTKLFRFFNKVDSDDLSDFERLDYYQPNSKTLYGSAYKGDLSYEEDKNNLIEVIRNYLSTCDNVSCIEEINNYLDSDNSTPKGVVTLLGKKYPKELNELTKNNEFQIANQRQIKAIKDTLKSMDRLVGIEDIINKYYDIFAQIMDDIENLMDNKVFRYFHVSETEFQKSISNIDKPLLLFKITNKDLSYSDTFSNGTRKSRGRENLHTMYFKALMSGEQDVFDIGVGQVFFREKSIDYNEEVKKHGHHANELKGKFPYPIIKDNRYSRDMFKFHLSIIINNKKGVDLNKKVNSAIRENDDIYAIGIDRGERNLLYFSVVDSDGRIVEQDSLNVIKNTYKGKLYEKDYQLLLKQREKKRDENRKNWQSIENIKDLKEGYLSQAVHKIAKLMVKYNAVLFMENLNQGMKRGRQKFERQVYDKFENMLVNKLSFYVDKEISETQGPTAHGGILNAYQLANVPNGKKDRSKQNGFIIYVPAWLTSKIDPLTGFANLFYTNLQKKPEIKNFFSKFKTIKYNEEDNYFEFSFDYSDFGGRGLLDYRNSWTVCSYGERIRQFKNQNANNNWDSEIINPTEKLKALFEKYDIDYLSNSLKDDILAVDKLEFLKSLLYYFKLMLQMRNSKIDSTDAKDDYIISPVKNKNGKFYDSRNYDDKSSLPANADANGAYNIARKGLWAIEQIRATEEGKKPKLNISNKEWLKLAQSADM